MALTLDLRSLVMGSAHRLNERKILVKFKETKSATMNIFIKFSFLFKSFVKVELNYVFT